MSDDFEFVKELPKERGSLSQRFAEALRQRPEEWALWPKDFRQQSSAYSTASNIRSGKLKNYEQGCFEAKVVERRVYARYVGG